MRLSSWSARLLTAALATVLLSSLMFVRVHAHVGGGFRPDCPACKQERTTGVSSVAAEVLVLAPALVDLDRVAPSLPGVAPSAPARNQTAPRSPPPPSAD